MPVDQKITGRSVLVLADTGFSQRRIAKVRETFGKKAIRFRHAFGADAPVTQVRIELGAMTIEGKFEPPALQVGESIRPARLSEVNPNREVRRSEALVACRRPEEKHLLAAWTDPVFE